MNVTMCVSIKFRINSDYVTLTLEPGEEDLYDQLSNDDVYTVNYIKLLIKNRLYVLNEQLNEIYRVDEDEREIPIYNACINAMEDQTSKNANNGDESENPGSSTSCHEKSADLWSDAKTRLMLDKYELYLPQIGPMKKFKTKKVMWAQIAKDMDNILNVQKTALQVENRYKTLLKRKKKAVENNSRSGSARENVPFEDELVKIANADDSIEPEILRSAKTVKYLKRTSDQISKDSCNNDNDTSGNSKKPRKLTACEQLIELHKQKEEAKESRHQEKLALIRELFSSDKNPDT